MRTTFQKKILSFARILELFIALLIVIAITFSALSLFFDLETFIKDFNNSDAFRVFLGHAFSTIIGIEFLKMLLKHSTSAVIEVLLFAIARQLIVEHTTSLENLLGILAIAILFGIRKFLYVSNFDQDDENEASDLAAEKGFLNRLKDKSALKKDDLVQNEILEENKSE